MTQSAPSPSLVQHILERIDLGQLNPGDLLDEAELVETFGVSRTPVREAILYLEALGLVRRLPRKGAAIFRPTLESSWRSWRSTPNWKARPPALPPAPVTPGAADLEAAVLACESHARTALMPTGWQLPVEPRLPCLHRPCIGQCRPGR